jgi:hypothetical protein
MTAAPPGPGGTQEASTRSAAISRGIGLENATDA